MHLLTQVTLKPLFMASLHTWLPTKPLPPNTIIRAGPGEAAACKVHIRASRRSSRLQSHQHYDLCTQLCHSFGRACADSLSFQRVAEELRCSGV